jgi:hypothetical protein
MLPGLILLFSAIDIFASLARQATKHSVTRADFIQWVDSYLLPKSGLACTATDLYAARCALVHTYTPKSTLSRERKAREIQYDPWGVDTLQDLIQEAGMADRYVGVSVEKLFHAFLEATERFELDVSSDPTRRAILESRIDELYRCVLPTHSEARLSLLRRVKQRSMHVASLSEFITRSAQDETHFVKFRDDDKNLHYLLFSRAKNSADQHLCWVASVGDEALHAQSLLDTISRDLIEAGHRVAHIDLQNGPVESGRSAY